MNYYERLKLMQRRAELSGWELALKEFWNFTRICCSVSIVWVAVMCRFRTLVCLMIAWGIVFCGSWAVRFIVRHMHARVARRLR